MDLWPYIFVFAFLLHYILASALLPTRRIYMHTKSEFSYMYQSYQTRLKYTSHQKVGEGVGDGVC